MRLSNRSMFFWLKIAGIPILLAIVIAIVMANSTFGGAGDQFKLEAYKLILQFLLVTVLGGLLLAFLNTRREDDQRVAARLLALQEFVVELGDSYRRLKVVKRRMRSQLLIDDVDADGVVRLPLRIREKAFETAMDELLAAQIAAEEVRDRIGVRSDILPEAMIRRIREALRYSSRYFHDVYQDYEWCKVRREGEFVIIGEECKNMASFLLVKSAPLDLPKKHQARLTALVETLRDDAAGLDARFTALEEIEKLRQRDLPHKRRYRVVATEGFDLSAGELRRALGRSEPDL